MIAEKRKLFFSFLCPDIVMSTAAAHRYRGCRHESLQHGKILCQAHLSLIAAVKLPVGGNRKAHDHPFDCLHMQASHQASVFDVKPQD